MGGIKYIKIQTLAPVILILIAVAAAYYPAMKGGYIWDDARYVTENHLLDNTEGLSKIWFDIGATIQYYPMVFTTFWVEHQIWDLDPRGYHTVNVLLHAFLALLLWTVLRKLKVPGAWFAAAIFALHPVHVESVAWITERKNVLSGVFYMASLLAFLIFEPMDDVSGVNPRRWKFYVLSLIMFALALLSKTVTSSLPAVIILLFWWKRNRFTVRNIGPLIPMFVLGLSMSQVTMWMEKNNVHAQGIDWVISFPERCLIASRAIWFYLWKLVYPAKLVFNYPRWKMDPELWFHYIPLIALITLIAALWGLRNRFGRAPLTAFLFFCGTLLPALGFFDIYPMRYSFVADHFQYLASIGPIALLTSALTIFLKIPVNFTWNKVDSFITANTFLRYCALPVLILIVLGSLTWHQGLAYKDRATIWQDTLSKNPSSFIAHCNLGGLLIEDGNSKQGIVHLREAVRLKPNFNEALCSLGKAMVEQGNVDEGLEYLKTAQKVRPDKAIVYHLLGRAYAEQEDFEQAVSNYEHALSLNPGETNVNYDLAIAYANLEKTDKAIRYFYEILEKNPNDAGTHNNIGNAFSTAGRYDEAIPHYKEAIQLRPGYGAAHRSLGLALAETGNVKGAINAYWLALRADPNNIFAHIKLAELLVQTGELEGAITEYNRALALDPNLTQIHQILDALKSEQSNDLPP